MSERKKMSFSDITDKIFIPGEDLCDYEFEVDAMKGIAHCKIRNCVFLMTPSGGVDFEGCDIEDCQFEGVKDHHWYGGMTGYLKFRECTVIKNVTINNQFREIFIQANSIEYLIDKSFATNYTSVDTVYWDSDILGQCKNMNYVDINFLSRKPIKWYKSFNIKDSLLNLRVIRKLPLWDKAIVSGATCQKVTFHDYVVEPFYFATKCDPKHKQVDLAYAHLNDDWSKLRKNYTGLGLVIVFLLTLVFFLPIIIKYLVLVSATNSIDASGVDTAMNLAGIEYRTAPFYQVLLFGGKTGISGWLHFTLAIILFAYNGMRIYITIAVAKLREEERYISDVNFPIVSVHPEKYKLLVKMSKVLSVLFVIAILYSLFKFYNAMQIEVIDLASFSMN